MLLTRLLALAGLVTASLTVAGPASTGATTIPSTAVGWCTTSVTRPCIESVSRAGVAVTESDPVWDVHASTYSVNGSNEMSFSLLKEGQYDLGSAELGQPWSFTFDMGTLTPRVVTGKGRETSVKRVALGGGTYRLTVKGEPVTVSGQCDQSVWPWVCLEADDPASDPVENQQWDALLSGQVTDYGSWDDAPVRDSMYGMDYWTNVAATSVPPEIVADPATGESMLLIRMANRHFLEDGTTPVRGESELRIPNSFLKLAYGVPNPALMTGSSLATTVSGSTSGAGTVNIFQEPGGAAMRVDIDGMTFSTRQVKIKRGVIVPTRPTSVRTKRLDAHRGRVAFDGARPRGARITGYTARCRLVNGTQTVRDSGSRSPLVVTALKKGRAYTCRVRAQSKAGAGSWSKVVRVSRRP